MIISCQPIFQRLETRMELKFAHTLILSKEKPIDENRMNMNSMEFAYFRITTVNVTSSNFVLCFNLFDVPGFSHFDKFFIKQVK